MKHCILAVVACLCVAACSPKPPAGVCAPAAHDFWRGQAGTTLLTSGWSEPESEFVWTNGSTSTLSLPNTVKGNAAILNFNVAPFLTSADQTQEVTVSSKGKTLATWRLIPGPQIVKVDLPPEATGGDVIVLDFAIATPRSPKDSGLSNDDRLLGFRLSSVKQECA